MSHIANDENLEKLKGSEQHHELKNRPGKEGDPNHVRKADKEALGVTPQGEKT
ncbi:hypothetical protein [Gymnodinialimonas ulvae]|uniref:hypothetical protein n=1 Tax=Gymnodinialimonas ulvae TaxID=3126504 RepID=UPI0030A99FDA